MSKMKALKRFFTAFLVAVLLVTTCAPVALASFKARINTTTKIYSSPSTRARSHRVPKGLAVTVTATSGSWARVKYNGHTAYMALSQLNLVNRLTAYTAKSTPVYRSASTSSKMGTLSIGTAVYVVGKSGSYYRVQNKSGSVTGYVKSGYLTTKAKLTAAYNAYKKSSSSSSSTKKSSTSSSSSAKLLALLESLLGRPYSSNAHVPSSFNCSTLVKYVMGKFGISMKSTAKEQARDSRYSKITSLSSLQVGDVLCFDEDKNGVCDHTAIYIGSGIFVEASRNAGKVRTKSFDSWYKSHFMWARRPSK